LVTYIEERSTPISASALSDAVQRRPPAEHAVGWNVFVAAGKETRLMARKYGKKASRKVKKAMHERKRGTLRSGSGKKVKSRKQAIAIALSQARKSGAKVPRKRSGKKKTARKKR
jgi:hypothetical protein